jgi:hypothetical protein
MKNETRRVLAIVAASLTVAVVGWVALIGSVLAWGGVATVRVAEKNGHHVSMPIPMAIVDAAVASSEILLDEQDLDLEVDLGEWGPLAHEILAVLDECPDAVLVEVEDRGEYVRIEKSGRHLLVAVRADEIDLEVRVPTKSIRRTVTRLVS